MKLIAVNKFFLFKWDQRFLLHTKRFWLERIFLSVNQTFYFLEEESSSYKNNLPSKDFPLGARGNNFDSQIKIIFLLEQKDSICLKWIFLYVLQSFLYEEAKIVFLSTFSCIMNYYLTEFILTQIFNTIAINKIGKIDRTFQTSYNYKNIIIKYKI